MSPKVQLNLEISALDAELSETLLKRREAKIG